MKIRQLLAVAGVGLGVTYLAIGELSHLLASRRGLGRPGSAVGRHEAIVVLGFPSRPDGSPHPLQRWRAKIAARSVDPRAASTTFICTGAAKVDEPSEAEMLARLLGELGVGAEQIVLETQARTTWQNLEFSAPLLAEAEVIKVASNSLHAWRGRRFLRRQRPDLAERLAAADDYCFGEYWWLKTPVAIYEAVGEWREWRSPRLPGAVSRSDWPGQIRFGRPVA